MKSATGHSWKWQRRFVHDGQLVQCTSWPVLSASSGISDSMIVHISSPLSLSFSQRIAKEKTMQTLKMKNEKLEKLCRALQSERNQLGKELKKVHMCLLSSPLPQSQCMMDKS